MAEYEEQAKAWFAAKGVHLRCTQCGGQKFAEGDLVPLATTDPSGEFNDGKGYWVFPLGCRNCGHFELFDARKMGLTPEQYR